MPSNVPLPLVSIIIPIYNVEPYLRECVDSVLEQSYSNIEVILVDDGSTDGSSDICDEYAETREEIYVIHQENRGLSGARNSGLASSRGEYISFVDSDDWLSPNMVSSCVKLMRMFDADACGVRFYLAYSDGRIIPNETFSTRPECYETQEALSRYLFNTNLSVCVCGKLWKRFLWDHIRCPEGKLHEDQHTTYRLIAEARRVVFDPEPLYYYRQREGSIGHSGFSERSYDLLDGVDAQYSYVSKKYPEIKGQIGAACSFWYMVFVNMMLRSGYWDDSAAQKCQRFVREHIRDICQSFDLPRKRKLQLTFFGASMTAYGKAYLQFIEKRDRG